MNRLKANGLSIRFYLLCTMTPIFYGYEVCLLSTHFFVVRLRRPRTKSRVMASHLSEYIPRPHINRGDE